MNGAGGLGGAAAGGGAGGSAPFCAPGLLECDDGTIPSCHPAAFTFESGTTDGFTVDALSSDEGAAIANSTAHAHTGTHSLASAATGASGSRVVARVNLCGQLESAMLEGATLSMWIYLEGTMPLPYPLSTYVQIGLFTAGGDIPTHEHIVVPGGLPIGSWTQITEYIDVANPGDIHFGNEATGLGIDFAVPGPPGWIGTIYFDDITITPAM